MTSMPPPVIYMTPEQLYAWRISETLSKRQAATALGVARNTYRAYEMGKYPIPRYIWLATITVSASRMVA